MKINLGCGCTPLEDYINVDMDTLEDLKNRYPHKEFSDSLIIKQWDIFNLPVESGTVQEIRADCLFEHLDFREEKIIFYEIKRALKTIKAIRRAQKIIFNPPACQASCTGGTETKTAAKPPRAV